MGTFSTFTILTYFLLIALCTSVSSRSHRSETDIHQHRSHNQNDRKRSGDENLVEGSSHSHLNNHIRRKSNHRQPIRAQGQRSSEEESEEDYGRHAYVMSTDHVKPQSIDDEHQTLQEAFQKHMNPNFKVPHDIYAYKLPSDLWFIVRYKKNSEGVADKYMNVVSSFTKYLDKMDASTKSVSVNVNGVETVFRLTSKS